MAYITHTKSRIFTLFIIILLFISQAAYAADTTTRYNGYDNHSTNSSGQNQGWGNWHQNSGLNTQINALASQPIVLNLRIPVLLGVKVANLSDTWGDARSEGRTHEGIDIMAPRGTPIVSPTDAVVITIENSGLGGNHVFTSNPGGERYYYAHLDSFAQGLVEGQVLKPGDVIGYVGNTGNAAGGATHLHFGIYHDNQEALNPFPRLTLEFSLQERIDAITKMLSSSPDPLALARTLVSSYRSTFAEAQANNIALPSQITTALAEKTAVAQSIGRTLKLGMKGDDVKALQEALGVSADGSFGLKTQAAVIAFQRAHNLTADGVFGAKSRAALGTTGSVVYPIGCTASTLYSATTGMKCTATYL